MPIAKRKFLLFLVVMMLLVSEGMAESSMVISFLNPVWTVDGLNVFSLTICEH